jgi:hypothetical protein
MSVLAGLALLAIFTALLVASAHRANELFLLEVRQGNAFVVRGRLPQRLFDEISDVVRRPRVTRAKIRVFREGGVPRVLARGEISSAQIQQLRNVLGGYQTAQIRAGGRRRR